MALTRVHVGLTPAQLKTLDKLALKLQLNRSNVMRFAMARLAEAEEIKP